MRKWFGILVVALALMASVVPVFGQDEPGTITDIVIASAGAETPEFSVLLAAVTLADPTLLEALSNPVSQLTVFAPTDAAFTALEEALGAEAFAAILADPAALTNILLYHVLDGAVMSADVVAGLEANEGAFSVPTLQGQQIDIAMTEEGGITIDGANLMLDMVDIVASNGVIHVIDAVIVPVTDTIADIVVASTEAETPEFTALLTAVAAADPAVLELLSNPEASVTVFAPTDAAFAALGADTLAAVLADQAMLTDILMYHVVLDGAIYAADLGAMLSESMDMTLTVPTALGADVTFMVDEEGNVFINDAQIVMTDIEAANGVVHVIDAVILPPSE
jgi:uncharacterized surface protein with fasciclin (FAS1) repeats